MKKMMVAVAVVLFCLGVAAPVSAGWPLGQWELKNYDDQTGNTLNTTNGICIVAGGTWYSTIFPSWSGNWFMKGNDLHLNGNYSTDGNDAFELTKIGKWHMDGYWQEWHDGNPVGFYTVKWAKKSNTCRSPAGHWIDQDSNPAD